MPPDLSWKDHPIVSLLFRWHHTASLTIEVGYTASNMSRASWGTWGWARTCKGHSPHGLQSGGRHGRHGGNDWEDFRILEWLGIPRDYWWEWLRIQRNRSFRIVELPGDGVVLQESTQKPKSKSLRALAASTLWCLAFYAHVPPFLEIKTVFTSTVSFLQTIFQFQVTMWLCYILLPLLYPLVI